ncbi:CPBP family intramembrane glutamic endopeptidase [Blastococcus sp. SYSU D00820]
MLALGLWNDVLVPRLPGGAGAAVAANAAATGALLGAARAHGMGAADLGLDPDRWGAGLRCGAAWSVPVVAGYGVVLATPRLRPLLADARIAAQGPGRIAARALVAIPVGTVLWEEVAFRGVLPAALDRVLPGRAAAGVAAALFGLWHAAPALDGLRANDVARGRAARAAAVLGVCAGTGCAGALFGWLRRRSGSLLAPAVLHLAVNVLGTLAAAAATRRNRGG